MFIVIVGAIGAGKTELIKRLRDEFPDRFSVVFENVAKWNENGVLEEFYSDRERHAFCFQLRVFNDYVVSIRSLTQQQDQENKDLLVERSIFCQPLFWALQKKTKNENDVYNAMWAMWRDLIPEPTHYIFLTPDNVDTLMDRVQNRARKGETLIPRSYEQNLVQQHKDFYKHDGKRFTEDNLLILRAENTIDSHVKKIKTWFSL